MSALPSEKTEALYQKDGTLHTHTSTLTSITPLSSLPAETQSLFKAPSEGTPYILTTPSTIFHAQGGGQPSDTGTITTNSTTSDSSSPTFHVHQVRKPPTTPSILHLGTFSPKDSPFPSSPSTTTHLSQTIDQEKRHLHSRLHTAGHALGLAIYLLTKAGTLPSDLKDGKASHYPGAAFVEFSGLIPGTAKQAIQEKVDELVSQDLSIKIHFWGEEEAERRCITGIEGANLGGADDEGGEGEKEVRVVEIGDLGSYPCGGTHVESLKGCGRVVVRTIKRQKGISKVSYEVTDA